MDGQKDAKQDANSWLGGGDVVKEDIGEIDTKATLAKRRAQADSLQSQPYAAGNGGGGNGFGCGEVCTFHRFRSPACYSSAAWIATWIAKARVENGSSSLMPLDVCSAIPPSHSI